MTKIVSVAERIVWGAPALILILGVGLFLSIRLGAVQLTLFPEAMKTFFRMLRPGRTREGGGSSFRSLCTALAATVGTGNLAGVAGAICLGGPGAVFWMWICGFLGMGIKYAEATLAVRYREQKGDSWTGGPMYIILSGMGKKWRWLASLYSLFGVVAAFGVGNAAQINAMITGINGVITRFGGTQTRSGNLLMGCFLALIVGAMLLGGAKRIGRAAEALVPFAAAGYILLCVCVLTVKIRNVPAALWAIVQGAFSPRAVTGGMVGSAFSALRIGCSRGVFTNEAGMGTASIAHASADVSHPARQGLMGIVEVFLDTIVICTLTALVILVSGAAVPYGQDAGAELTTLAFSAVFGDAAAFFLAAALCCFALATILGWGLYGARCAEFLFGSKAWKGFVLVQTLAVVAASAMETGTVWALAEIVNGLMVIPNLIALAALSQETVRLTKEYKKSGGHAAGGGNYADFHQRKPL